MASCIALHTIPNWSVILVCHVLSHQRSKLPSSYKSQVPTSHGSPIELLPWYDLFSMFCWALRPTIYLRHISIQLKFDQLESQSLDRHVAKWRKVKLLVLRLLTVQSVLVLRVRYSYPKIRSWDIVTLDSVWNWNNSVYSEVHWQSESWQSSKCWTRLAELWDCCAQKHSVSVTATVLTKSLHPLQARSVGCLIITGFTMYGRLLETARSHEIFQDSLDANNMWRMSSLAW